ncbi:uncharacterized protein L969DRAFT_95270 [Mixia osmundae IAM 14324]|uniref:uncharacterized protein n=1 Tax=Mixia osmundae (strain CBS 9802 / IAM 14324 / JCM 22182 / KY 12970) TaxID=764103 RepID=UPI0004A547E4|nr:uncharacterized protein L969DRAFT_95270 [Mixia osmundae IAM 14324]KEI39127.1 hypothetical protein L969DRAFT_95270 [Mixia osmundae IAM 14324]
MATISPAVAARYNKGACAAVDVTTVSIFGSPDATTPTLEMSFCLNYRPKDGYYFAPFGSSKPQTIYTPVWLVEDLRGYHSEGFDVYGMDGRTPFTFAIYFFARGAAIEYTYIDHFNAQNTNFDTRNIHSKMSMNACVSDDDDEASSFWIEEDARPSVAYQPVSASTAGKSRRRRLYHYQAYQARASEQLSHCQPACVYYGTFVHSLDVLTLEYLKDTLLGVDEQGVISFVEQGVSREDVKSRITNKGSQWQDAKIVRLARGDFIVPGLGLGQQHELLDWLEHITFPAERKFENPVYAQKAYEAVVTRVINSGTTTCAYYATLHLEASKRLANVCFEKGQRALIGKCCMDRNSPTWYREKSAAQSVEDTKRLVAHVRDMCYEASHPLDAPQERNHEVHRTSSISSNSSASSTSSHSSASSNGHHKHVTLSKSHRDARALVHAIVTPRFAISCSDALLASLQALLAQDKTLRVQTHLSESPAEISYTRELFPFADTYTHVYDHFGLLKNNTILAHCIHLDDAEMELIRAKGSGIAHCPSSNLNLRSGASRVAEMLSKGMKVGLGTDVSGGFGFGILTALREASVVSKVLAFSARDNVATTTKGRRGRSQTPKGEANIRVTSQTGRSTVEASSDKSVQVEVRTDEGEDIKATAEAADGPDFHPDFANRHLPLETLFYLATLGGAQVCAFDEQIGNFLVGKDFDALLVQTGQKEPDNVAPGDVSSAEDAIQTTPSPYPEGLNPAIFVEPDESIETLFEKFLFCGDDRNIGSVFVRGRCIGGARPLQR